MPKEKALHNKTINTTLSEGLKYLARCIKVKSSVESIESVLDKTVRGDTFEVMPLLPGELADLVIADPPYNLTKSYAGSCFTKKKTEEYEEYTRKWLTEVSRLMKPDASIYVCCDWESSLIIGRVLGEFFNVKSRITWERDKGRGAKTNWKNCLEDIWFATKGKSYTFNLDAVMMRKKVLAPYRQNGEPKGWTEYEDGNYRDTCPSNFWDDITIPFWSMPENTEHPTQKPEKLIAKLILASSDEGDVVFDPFLGSGTTSVTAKKLGRHYIGIENVDQYCLWTEERLEMAESDKTIQGFTDGVFWERNTLIEQRKKNK